MLPNHSAPLITDGGRAHPGITQRRHCRGHRACGCGHIADADGAGGTGKGRKGDHPGRIDLGLGRGPRARTWRAARALRRHMAREDSFPQDVQELMGYFRPASETSRVRAIPGEGTQVPIWILGSSLYGAQLAAAFGLPYAFASHFAPDMLEEALEIYRAPSSPLTAARQTPCDGGSRGLCSRPPTQRQTLPALLATSRLRTAPHGQPGQTTASDPRPSTPKYRHRSGTGGTGPVLLRHRTRPQRCATAVAQSSPTYQPDELIITGMIHDHSARIRSFEIAAQILGDLSESAVAA